MNWTKFTDKVPDEQNVVYVFADEDFRNFCLMELHGIETTRGSVCWCFCDLNDEEKIIPEVSILSWCCAWCWWLPLPKK